MFKESDFRLSDGKFHIKNDSYPLSKINDVRVKRLSLIDNLGQILFWIVIFSGMLWLALSQVGESPFWLKLLAGSLSATGLIFALFRCSRYALQIEFNHIDETGLQWINVAKSFSSNDYELFEKQVVTLKGKFV
ncbi:hypothetical protein ACOBWL_003515 [Vibrio cholerae]|uniref:hypothetical protein n=1 Tax=Vibrio TaxID=662 RepID=UPI0005115AC8|nr:MULTISPECIES: hypothetical protein [Vibrio]EGR4051601.1 hypothetical protein [Vibrio cholerae]EHR7684339.1 hypothetical protein [Vibrio cholerae]EHT2844962.1 hypothetical protein [Vibrio cholerae]EIC9870686.1 hypothetical protein [Vibrio cholerae]EII5613954.1 hypothetical protein [Vibrio cholerae]